jgi:glycine betaine/proline transport system substrate-binding protein
MLYAFRSWLQRIPSVVALVGGLAGIAFSVVYVLCTLRIICGDDPIAVSPAVFKVHAGQLVTIQGSNLNLVSEIRLVKGDDAFRVPFILYSQSRLVLTVHNEVPDGEYNLEFKPTKGHLVTTELKLSVFQRLPINGPKLHGPKPLRQSIIFANLNWDSARLQNAIARFIIEHGYKYPTDSIPTQDNTGNAKDLWKGLIRGTIHVTMEVWLPDQQDAWDKAMADATVIPLGKSLDDQWQSAFVVPTYVIEGDLTRGIKPRAPGLKKVEDLRTYKEVFTTPLSQGKAILLNCPAIWVCAQITRAQVKAYGLDDVIEIQDPGSADGLFSALGDAYEKGEPWLGYMWGPSTRPARGLGLTTLEEPPYSPGCWATNKQCGYGPSRIRIAVNPSLVYRAPDVIQFLRKWDFNTTTLDAAMDYLEQTDMRFEDAAIMYLKNQEALWTQWVPTDVAVQVKAALEDH